MTQSGSIQNQPLQSHSKRTWLDAAADIAWRNIQCHMLWQPILFLQGRPKKEYCPDYCNWSHEGITSFTKVPFNKEEVKQQLIEAAREKML